MEGLFRLIGTLVTILIVFAVLYLLAGGKPEPCPRHICLPDEEVVTAEMLLAERAQAEEAKGRAVNP